MHISKRTVLVLFAMLLCTIVVLVLAVAPNAVEKPVSPTDKEYTLKPVMAIQTAARTVTTEEPIEEIKLWTEEDVTVLAKMLWGEARGVLSDTEKAACVWCVLNRVDQGMGTIVEVVTAPYQFIGYQEDHPIDPELKALCEDVLDRWHREKNGETNVGRVLPSDYLFFTGDGKHNHFRNAYKNGEKWTWDYETPYEN